MAAEKCKHAAFFRRRGLWQAAKPVGIMQAKASTNGSRQSRMQAAQLGSEPSILSAALRRESVRGVFHREAHFRDDEA